MRSPMRIVILFLFVTIVFPCAVSAAETTPPSRGLFPAPDRAAVRRLEQVGQLIERDRISDAVPLLGSILETEEDFFLEPDRPGERLSRGTLKSVAEDRLRSLSEEGRRLYAMQYDPLARRLLNLAIETGSVRWLEKIAADYYYSEAGNDAAFLLAMHRFDQGAAGSALLLLRRIAQGLTAGEAYEPLFSLTLAACEKRLGYEKAASETLERFLRRHPNPRIRISGGEFWNPATLAELSGKLDSWETEPDTADWIAHSGWLSSQGIPTQNPDVAASAPLLDRLWSVPALSQTKQANLFRLIEGSMRYDGESYLPIGRPILVGEILVFRGADGLVGVHSKTGKRLWIGKETEYLMPISATSYFRDASIYSPNIPQLQQLLLRMSLCHNQTLGTLNSDGRLVFSIEDEPDPLETRENGRAVLFGQGKPLDDPRKRIGTTIAAREVKTGEVVWRVGKAPFVQKQLERIEEQLQREHRQEPLRQPGLPAGGAGIPRAAVPVGRGKVVPLFPRRGIPIGPVPIPVAPAPEAEPEPESERQEPPKDDVSVPAEAAEPKQPEAKQPELQSNPSVEATAIADSTIRFEKQADSPDSDVPSENPDDSAKAESGSKILISEEERFLGETYFLGPPLPVGDCLFVLGENAGVIRLFVLDSRTGRLIRHQGLVQPSVAIETDWLRRYRGPVPAYEEGILVCPTAAGAVAVLDGGSGKLLWCYRYADIPKESEGDSQQSQPGGPGGFGMIGRFNNSPFNMSGFEEEFRYLVNYVGWQIPSTMIERGKLVLTPADSPFLYCFDLLSGELLWKRAKGLAKYVGCICDNRVILVGPHSLIGLDLESGKAVWDDTELTPLPKRDAPDMFGRSRASARADRRRASDLFAEDPEPEPTEEKPDGFDFNSADRTGLKRVAFPNGTTPSGVGVRNGDSYMIPMSDRSVVVVNLLSGETERIWKSLDDSKLGNLLALGGKMYSQSTTTLECFDQLDSLSNRANLRLGENPEDFDGTFALGRIAYAQGDRDKALALFRKAFRSKSTPKVRALLRTLLGEAIESDFVKYKPTLQEIETLGDTPDSLGSLLYAFAVGSLEAGDDANFAVALKKLIDLDQQHHLTWKFDARNQLLLARWIGQRIRDFAKKPELTPFLHTLAEEELNQILNTDQTGTADRGPVQRQLKQYLEYFGSFPIAEQAKKQLFQLYARDNRLSEMEFLTSAPGISLFPKIFAGKNDSQDEETTHVQADGKADEYAANESLLALAKGLEEKGHYSDALHYYRLAGTAAPEKPEYEKILHPRLWPQGKVVQSEQPTERKKDSSDSGPPSSAPFGMSEVYSASIPYVGTYSRFQSDCEFWLEGTNQTADRKRRLYCRNANGQETWSVVLPESEDDDPEGDSFSNARISGINFSAYPDFVFSNQQGFLKGYNHILYYVWGKRLLAIDTLKRDAAGDAVVLWQKNMPVPFAPASYLPGALKLRQIAQFRNYGNERFVDPVFVNSQVLCFHNFDSLWGVDPLTGETLWVREASAIRVFLTGDDRYIYQISSASKTEPPLSVAAPYLSVPQPYEAIVLESATGERLARGVLPPGLVHCFESKLVSLDSKSWNAAEQKVEIYDLADLIRKGSLSGNSKEEKKARALSTDPNAIFDYSLKPRFSLSSSLSYEAILGVQDKGRLLALLDQDGTLRMIDLATVESVGPSIKAPKIENKNQQKARSTEKFEDFFIEWDEGEYLVLFVANLNTYENSQGRNRNRENRTPLEGIPYRNVGHGYLMRYTAQGEPVWDNPVSIERWYYIPRPSGLPVLLFGATIFEQRRNSEVQVYPLIWGLDKKTGKRRFEAKLIEEKTDRSNRGPFSGFRIVSDPDLFQLKLITNRRTFVETFTEATEEPPEGEKRSDEAAKKTASDSVSLSKVLSALGRGVIRQIEEQYMPEFEEATFEEMQEDLPAFEETTPDEEEQDAAEE